MIHRGNGSLLALLVALAGFGAVQAPLHAQPDDLVGFRLGQDMREVKKARRSQLHLLIRGRADEALRGCGLDTYEIEQGGERLEITAVQDRIVKLDLSKSLNVASYDPLVMASKFISGFGPPKKTACKPVSGDPEEHTLPSECKGKPTFVELHYWRGEENPQTMVTMRIRLRSPVTGNKNAFNRVTLSRGWDARIPKLKACGEKVAKDLGQGEIEGLRTDIPAGLQRPSWTDPPVDQGWVAFIVSAYAPYLH